MICNLLHYNGSNMSLLQYFFKYNLKPRKDWVNTLDEK